MGTMLPQPIPMDLVRWKPLVGEGAIKPSEEANRARVLVLGFVCYGVGLDAIIRLMEPIPGGIPWMSPFAVVPVNRLRDPNPDGGVPVAGCAGSSGLPPERMC